MNQKEIAELRRRWRPEKSAVSRIYGCFVNSSHEIVSDLDESLGMMPQEEAEKYLGLLKKAPVRHPGQEPDRHRVFHPAGHGQRGSTGSSPPCAPPGSRTAGPAGVLPKGY